MATWPSPTQRRGEISFEAALMHAEPLPPYPGDGHMFRGGKWVPSRVDDIDGRLVVTETIEVCVDCGGGWEFH